MNVRSSRVILPGVFALAAACSSSTPTAVPTPAPTPTPTPAPAATPQAFVCPLPARPDLQNICPRVNSQLLPYVNNAIDAVMRQQPQLFDFNDLLGGSVRVKDRQRYQTAVVAAINAQGGVCAKDDNEEVAVKVTNDYHEQFNIWTSSGYTRRSYISTCFPAQF